MDGVGILALTSFKRREHLAFRFLNLALVDVGGRNAVCILRCRETGATTKHDEVRKGIAAQTICAMQASSGFASSVEAGNCRLRCLRVNANAAHHVMARGADFHWLLG